MASEVKGPRSGRVLVAGILLLAFVAGVGNVTFQALRPRDPAVRGVLLDVRAASIVHAESVTLRDDDGRVWTFRVDPEVATNRQEPQSAAHLRQHLALGDAVRVRYRDTPDGPLAVRILDDP